MAFVNFHWKNGIFGGDVEFTHAKSKEDAVFWLSYIPPQHMRNKFTINRDTNKKQPGNWDKFTSGGDPFKFDTKDVVDKKRMSSAAMTIWAEYDSNIDTSDVPPEFWVTGDMCGEACFRHDDMSVDEMNEQYLMACIFFGMKFFPEKNVGGVVEYFKRTGFEHYIQFDMKFARTDGGIYLKEAGLGSNTDPISVQAMFKVVQKYVKERGMRCKFYRTLEQLLDVTPENMSDRDLFVSLGKCLRVVMDFNPIRQPEPEEEENISDIVAAVGGMGRNRAPNRNQNSGWDTFRGR
jgi:hypothetical protein